MQDTGGSNYTKKRRERSAGQYIIFDQADIPLLSESSTQKGHRPTHKPGNV
jgi:hypothetical protein